EASALRLRADAPVTAGALLEVAPSSDEPIVVEEGGRASDPEETRSTAGPDDAASTAGPASEQATSGPDGAASTAGPDGAASTAGPDGDEAGRQVEPVLHPAGESAWVAAVPLSTIPVGMALPDLADLPRLPDLPDGSGVGASGGD